MTWIFRALRTCSMGCAILLIGGCGLGGNAQPADASQAVKTLTTVLDAWKAGEKPDDLEKRTPPIRIKDEDWKDGFVLVSYKADQEGRLVGYDMNYPVTLELKSPKGKSVKKNAMYTITTSPGLLVARQEG